MPYLEDIPVVPHGIIERHCSGCIVAEIKGDQVELRCNECAVVVGQVRLEILRELLGLGGVNCVCPMCGHSNHFPAVDQQIEYTCRDCGAAVRLGKPTKSLPS